MAIYDRDYLTTLPLLYEKANEYSDGEWNKYNNDVGDTILKLLASSSHTVDYYFRKFLTALILPNDDWDQKALIWELTGYKPNYLRADYLMVQLYWPDCGLDSYVPLYQYTPFKITADGKEYIFLCAQDYIIPPLTTRANIRLVNGSLETIEQDYTQIRNNKIKLTDDDIDYDLVTVVVSGTKWTQVRNVFYSPDTERIYSVHKESDGTYIYLHSSWQEYVDSYDTSFVIRFVKSFYDFNLFTDECMTVEFQTELLTIDGDDVSQYYKIIPLLNSDEALDATNLMPSTTEGNRAITTLDFEANAALFPGIASCKAYDWNTPVVCTTPFEVVLVACDSKGKLSEHMKQVLKAYLESICSPLITVRTIEPRFAKQDILVVLDIGDYKGTLAEKEIKKVVERSLAEFYEIGNLPPGRIVKTKELNSLLLHADSRIYFATTSFLNSPVNSPLLIPVLGSVIVITSADAITYYDFGFGSDKAYVELRRFEWPDSYEKADDVGMFLAYTIRANVLYWTDKYPLQLFESVNTIDSKPIFNIGSGDLPVADFGYGDGFVHVSATGGTTDGPLMSFVYETNGSSVLMDFTDTEITASVQSELQFTNSQAGSPYSVDPGITSLTLNGTDVQSVKNALASAFNSVPDLVDANGQPFNITGDDIHYMSEQPLTGAGPDSTDQKDVPYNLSDVVSKLKSGDSDGAEEVVLQSSSPLQSSGDPVNITVNENLNLDEREFIYIPYTNSIKKELIRSKESSSIHKINLTVQVIRTHSYKSYFGFGYESKGRYTSDPNAYGDLSFSADTNLSIDSEIKLYKSAMPELYSENAVYGKQYAVMDKNGATLHWYFVSTSPVQMVAETVEIGYGIIVGFNLLRDTGIYVETDPDTSRGFIYSSEMESSDFYILSV